MKIAQWLDAREAEKQDVSTIEVPKKMFYAEDPAETIYYKEIRPCGIFCTKDHPFATVVRYGHWYHARGRDREEGIHSSMPQWSIFTKDRELALQKARAHIEEE